MVLALVLALLGGQTLYEWVDELGESHFTDDVSTIPAKAKRRVTTGEEIMVTPAAPKIDAGVRPARLGPDSCAQARAQIARLEQQREKEKVDFEKLKEAEGLACQRMQGATGARYAQCMASRTQAQPHSSTPAQLETAQETLRRAQANGCL